jgi:hypothetical protein
MPAIDKRKVSLQLKIETIAKIDHAAIAAHLSRNAVVQGYLDKATEEIVLTPEEIQEVAEEIKMNSEARKHGN